MRALIIDDSPLCEELPARTAPGERHRMRRSRDGQAALDLLHCGGRFDLAFVDWNMPVMNGLEMLKRLRAEHYAE